MTHVCLEAMLAILVVLVRPAVAPAWGSAGHALVVRAALAASEELPRWFRDEGAALAALSNAPDRWRDEEQSVPALAARRPDHFFDLDVWGAEPLPADRWAYVARAERRHLRPETVGLLPFALQEECGVLQSAFRDARAGQPGAQAAALAAAGVVAHLAGDAAVPLHASRHHHGWIGPNPRGFTRDAGVHAWFESELVARVEGGAIRPGAEAWRPFTSVPSAVEEMLADSLVQVPRLYELERRARAEGDDDEARALVRERLTAGATLLARLWCTAWVRSAR
jgi:hypothetical protein